MIVVDSSVLIEVAVGSAQAKERIADEDLCAPHLIDVEVGNALRRMVMAGRIGDPESRRTLRGLAVVEIHRYEHTHLLARAWELRNNVTFYDAMYIALAEALDVTLLTCDGALAGVPRNRALVEILPSV